MPEEWAEKVIEFVDDGKGHQQEGEDKDEEQQVEGIGLWRGDREGLRG